MKNLDELRKQVSEIDRELISLIGKRIEMTKKIGEKKKEAGIPLRNWEVEKAVIDNAATLAAELGISGVFVKSVMQKLIEESRIQQEMFHYSAYQGNKENVLIIGGLGEIGRWFSYFFQNQGHDVSIYDIRGKSNDFRSYESLDGGITEASCALIATSLQAVPKIINELTDLRFEGIVFDIASLKGHLKHAIKRAVYEGISITSIHPMFGANTRTLSDKVICFCDCGNEEANSKVEQFFDDTAVSMVRLSLEEHDRAISYVLGLSHILNIIYIRVLMDGGYAYEELKKIASTTYLSQMVTASSVIKENPHLYYEIQNLNPFKEDLFDTLIETTITMADMITEGNKKNFVRIMEKGRDWLGE